MEEAEYLEEYVVPAGMTVIENIDSLSEEEIKNKILEEVKKQTSKDLSDESKLSVSYDVVNKVDDNKTIIRFTVKMISKDKSQEDIDGEEVKVRTDGENYLREALDAYKSLKTTIKVLYEELDNNKEWFDALTETLQSLETNSMDEIGMNSELKNELDNINESIDFLLKSLEEEEKLYEATFDEIQKLVDEEKLALEDIDLLTDEELINFRKGYAKKKLIESEKATVLKNKIKGIKRELSSLAVKRIGLEGSILNSGDLGITLQDYKEIENILQKKKAFDAILKKKGMSLDTDDRIAKEEIEREIADAKMKSRESSILDVVEALYDIDKNLIMEENPREVILPAEEFGMIASNSLGLPEKISNKVPQNYTPGKAPDDMHEVYNRQENEVLERITIYSDLNNGKKYVRKNVFSRFNLPLGEEVRINGALCYEINDDDLEFILGNADNEYSPYRVEEKEVNLNLENQSVDSGDSNFNIPNNDLDNQISDSREKIVIYVDLDNNNKKYTKKYVFNRFNIEILGNEKIINKAKCFELEEEDLEYIVGNANNEYSPYEVVFENVHLGKENEVNEDNSSENSNDDVTEEVITLYRDLNDNNQVYASEDVLGKFEIPLNGNHVIINDENCYKISNDADRIINYIAKNSTNPKITLKYIDVRLKKQEKPHVEAILDKLTNDLDIKAKDCKRFRASNIKVADSFKKELKSGNFLYNVFHFVPSVIKLPFMFAKKLVGKLMTSARAKKSMTELQRRLDEDLTEDELEVLFDEYKGSQLKTDMNNQINGLIGQRLTRYGLEKVDDLNNNIKDSYANLFALLGQIKAIEQQLTNDELDEDIVHELMVQRSQLVDKSSEFVKSILVSRKDANNLLSSGVHGIEEDFKAVASKLSYVGMRFAKTNNFDNELQHKLASYGQGLNEALSNGNNEEILNNFMGLESCYFENTKVARSLKGKRSVGSKYYSPVAEQFDYRDDPFIRDIFTTLAVTSATVSAVNSIRVHQIEGNQMINEANQKIENANASNDSIMDYVHQNAKDITNKRSTFREGMEAQAHKDVLSSANTIERAELDMHNWSFTDAYRAADAEGHAFYNQFSDNVTSQINDIASKYGSGSINSVEALQLMSEVSNKAHSTLTNVSNECLDIIKNYAESHPQFDLSAIQDSMNYIVQHPDAITNMNQGMIDVTNIASGLTELEATHLETLSCLPSDMLSTLVCAASATGLALNVSRTMKDKYAKKKGYGNEVTEMMKEYLGQNDAYEENIEDFEENFDENLEDDFENDFGDDLEENFEDDLEDDDFDIEDLEEFEEKVGKHR